MEKSSKFMLSLCSFFLFLMWSNWMAIMAASCESVGAFDRTATYRHWQFAAVLPTSRGCIVSRDGGIAAVPGWDAVQWISWLLGFIWECGKLYGADGHGHGKARDFGGVYSPGNFVLINSCLIWSSWSNFFYWFTLLILKFSWKNLKLNY